MNIIDMTLSWKTSDLNILFKEKASSTNQEAKKIETQFPLLLITDEQPQGRGRGENIWISPPKNTALLSSWVFESNFAPQPCLSPLVGLALFKSVKSAWTDIHFSLKAPNDLYIKNKKVAGLLVEIINSGSKNKIIIGLGFNIFDKVNIDISTYLNHYTENITETQWHFFLNSFYSELKALIQTNPDHLKEKDAHFLKEALNLNPNLNPKVEKITAKGDLYFNDKIIPWSSL